jgi:sodium/potassium/calcium exchanger 6
VLLLTITLPVVEIAREDVGEYAPDTQQRSNSLPNPSSAAGEDVSPLARQNMAPPDAIRMDPDRSARLEGDSAMPDDWNRWLIFVHVFTAPFFIVLVFWANTRLNEPWKLLRPSLISLVVSLSILVLLLLTTAPDRPPRWHPLLSFLGFAVSIAWISTIAGEVVGVLKAIGVILDISDAILGLTIFAVGNSLGDLVANVTVARLGYPVMALSACFGGPMLNILLGIGLSGSYMTIRGANERHRKHPHKEFKIKPFEVDIDRTLIISGIALLVTLVGLLIVVPMRKWMMDRVVGWALILMWITATVGNLTVEIWTATGLERDS